MEYNPKKFGPPKLYPVQTAISLTQAQHDWLKSKTGGQSDTIRRLIDEAMKLDAIWSEPEQVTA
jgi:hypothetical protein